MTDRKKSENIHLQTFISYNVVNTINGFETGIYNIINQQDNSRVETLSRKHSPFIDIYKDLHEKYFTDLHNQLVQKDPQDLFKSFDLISGKISHSIFCLLNILAQITPYIHFNFNRKNLCTDNLKIYIESVDKETLRLLKETSLHNLTNHQCTLSDITQRKLLSGDNKFVNININKNINKNKKN